MAKKLLAAVLGGLVVFIWSSLSHLVFGLGSVGIQDLPAEETVLPVLRQNVLESGFYFFPGMGAAGDESLPEAEQAAAMQAWESKIRQGPVGILVYRAGAQEPMSPAQLLNELLFSILAALVVVVILAQVTGVTHWISRALLVSLMGLFASFDLLFSYWNWYGFPTDYTLAATADVLISWFLAGLVINWLAKPPERRFVTP